MPNIVFIAGAVAILVCGVIVVGRMMGRPGHTRKEELSVSRAWLAENQSRNGSE